MQGKLRLFVLCILLFSSKLYAQDKLISNEFFKLLLHTDSSWQFTNTEMTLVDYMGGSYIYRSDSLICFTNDYDHLVMLILQQTDSLSFKLIHADPRFYASYTNFPDKFYLEAVYFNTGKKQIACFYEDNYNEITLTHYRQNGQNAAILFMNVQKQTQTIFVYRQEGENNHLDRIEYYYQGKANGKWQYFDVDRIGNIIKTKEEKYKKGKLRKTKNY